LDWWPAIVPGRKRALSGWATTNNQIALCHKIIHQFEAGFRSDTKRQYLQTFLLRTGAFVQLNKQWSLVQDISLPTRATPSAALPGMRQNTRPLSRYGLCIRFISVRAHTLIKPFCVTGYGSKTNLNRSLVATGYRFFRRVDLELSYMLRVIKDAGSGWSRENLLQLTGFTRL
jgi:hypothetical protein